MYAGIYYGQTYAGEYISSATVLIASAYAGEISLGTIESVVYPSIQENVIVLERNEDIITLDTGVF